MWYHNDKMINYDGSGNAYGDGSSGGPDVGSSGKVRVVTEYTPESTRSRLLVTDARPAHSGNYTCRASNTEPDSVFVFVSTDGDNIAAIQRQDASSVMHPCLTLLCIVLSAHRMVHW
ncbi:Cell adhesion molecule [Nesidiocoris tenuis]|uniref:Cell adhesion molecule n=1 Tax=Nesidiocoris tenuis TaxID=355587 RepID=A0ABN7BGA5_9HEMI|nr:Cell adhesion molecule [Nesidiocoris tenuis]